LEDAIRPVVFYPAINPSVAPAELACLPIGVAWVEVTETAYAAGFLWVETWGGEGFDAMAVAENYVPIDAAMGGAS
jgi:hypothetical protein